jgi:putative addiction module CopG family antidote
MNVSLPGRLKTYVDGKVASGVYGSTSEFVREAIREKLQRDIERQQARSAVAGKLIEGIESGDPIEFDDQYFARKKQTLLRRHGKKKRA